MSILKATHWVWYTAFTQTRLCFHITKLTRTIYNCTLTISIKYNRDMEVNRSSCFNRPSTVSQHSWLLSFDKCSNHHQHCSWAFQWAQKSNIFRTCNCRVFSVVSFEILRAKVSKPSVLLRGKDQQNLLCNGDYDAIVPIDGFVFAFKNEVGTFNLFFTDVAGIMGRRDIKTLFLRHSNLGN